MRMLVEFEKTETVRWLGLLDLQRTLMRALRRSGLPVAYSNGFNPHIQMSLASALASGISGLREIMDVNMAEEVTPEECIAALSRVLPPSLPVRRVRMVPDRFPKSGALVSQAEYMITLNGVNPEAVISGIDAFLAKDTIMATRKSKRAEKLINIRPLVHLLTGEKLSEDAVRLLLRVSFTEADTLKPDLFLSSFSEMTGITPEYVKMTRTQLLAVVNGNVMELMEVPA